MWQTNTKTLYEPCDGCACNIHQHRKAALAKPWAMTAWSDNDTCPGCTSQSRAPRYKHGERCNSYGAGCRPPFGLPMKTSEISFHGEIYFIWTAAAYLAAAKGLIENKSCEKRGKYYQKGW